MTYPKAGEYAIPLGFYIVASVGGRVYGEIKLLDSDFIRPIDIDKSPRLER